MWELYHLDHTPQFGFLLILTLAYFIFYTVYYSPLSSYFLFLSFHQLENKGKSAGAVGRGAIGEEKSGRSCKSDGERGTQCRKLSSPALGPQPGETRLYKDPEVSSSVFMHKFGRSLHLTLF